MKAPENLSSSFDSTSQSDSRFTHVADVKRGQLLNSQTDLKQTPVLSSSEEKTSTKKRKKMILDSEYAEEKEPESDDLTNLLSFNRNDHYVWPQESKPYFKVLARAIRQELLDMDISLNNRNVSFVEFSIGQELHLLIGVSCSAEDTTQLVLNQQVNTMDLYEYCIIPSVLQKMELKQDGIFSTLTNIHTIVRYSEAAEFLLDITNIGSIHRFSGSWNCAEPKMSIELGKFNILAQSLSQLFTITAAENFTLKSTHFSRFPSTTDEVKEQFACKERCCPQMSALRKMSEAPEWNLFYMFNSSSYSLYYTSSENITVQFYSTAYRNQYTYSCQFGSDSDQFFNIRVPSDSGPPSSKSYPKKYATYFSPLIVESSESSILSSSSSTVVSSHSSDLLQEPQTPEFIGPQILLEILNRSALGSSGFSDTTTSEESKTDNTTKISEVFSQTLIGSQSSNNQNINTSRSFSSSSSSSSSSTSSNSTSSSLSTS